MDATPPAKYEELTSDPFELELLTDEYVDIIEPSDPYYREVTRLQTQMQNLRERIPSKRFRIMQGLLKGKTKKELIQELQTSYPTIAITTRDPECQTYVACYMRTQRLQSGPTLEARSALLWRIALRVELDQPRVSIAAVDALNKQDGTYSRNDDISGDSGVQVTVNNFIMDGQPVREVTTRTQTAHVIEGDFTPVTVETPPS